MVSSAVQLQYVCKTKFTYLIKFKWHIIHIHDWGNFDHTVKKNMEIDDLKSYTHDLINILFK